MSYLCIIQKQRNDMLQKLTTKIPAEQKDELQALATANGTNVSIEVRKAIKTALKIELRDKLKALIAANSLIFNDIDYNINEYNTTSIFGSGSEIEFRFICNGEHTELDENGCGEFLFRSKEVVIINPVSVDFEEHNLEQFQLDELSKLIYDKIMFS